MVSSNLMNLVIYIYICVCVCVCVCVCYRMASSATCDSVTVTNGGEKLADGDV